MAKCKKGSTVGTHLPFELIETLEQRANKIGWTVSKYIAYILQDWYDRGCPAINNIEEAMGIPNAIEAKASNLADSIKATIRKGKKDA